MNKCIKIMLVATATLSSVGTALGKNDYPLQPEITAKKNLPESMVVKNSYIVSFKSPNSAAMAGRYATPFILPARTPISSLPKQENRTGIYAPVPFGEHSSGQSKKELAKELGIQGEVVSIFDNINAIHIRASKKEASRLSRDERVLRVEQDRKTITSTSQFNSGWGLDRMDDSSTFPALNNTYNYAATGMGRDVYVLDTGLNLNNPTVAAEFDHWRADIVWDVSGGNAEDCAGHGTQVSSIIAGNTYGVAKGARIHMAKISYGCSDAADLSASIAAMNWIATNTVRGTIAIWSHELKHPTGSCAGAISADFENAIKATHNNGIIVVVAAGNNNCDTANFSPTRIPEAFVVGATSNAGLPGVDRKMSPSRTGWNIATFAPGQNVPAMNMNGSANTVTGTSFSAAYIAGTFALACQAAAPYCDNAATNPNAGVLYNALKTYGGTLGTVTHSNGTPLTGATSRFISQRW